MAMRGRPPAQVSPGTGSVLDEVASPRTFLRGSIRNES
jgi:hypothetical protein